MKILALIPARGGSKRVPDKNIKLLGGLPLIAWTIRAALDSGVCADVLVSTDEPSIAEVARRHGALVPWLRPAGLSSDIASSVDVALHAIDGYESGHARVDGLLLLQPTSPFRSVETIRRAVSLFAENEGRQSVVGVSPASCHPCWCFRASERGMEPFLGWDQISVRSQDLEPAWMLNGAIYLIDPRMLRDRRVFLSPDTWPLKMLDPQEAIDIDTPKDWARAEEIMRARKHCLENKIQPLPTGHEPKGGGIGVMET